MNPYADYIAQLTRSITAAGDWQLGGFPAPPAVEIPAAAPKLLIFSPHPDDECIIGGLALRCLRELKQRVVNVAVTQGSNMERRGPRYAELTAACNFLGFGLIQTQPGGLERINEKGRADQAHWQQAVARIAEILQAEQPQAIMFPHAADWNSSHIGTHHLLVDALSVAGIECLTIETEFWGAMAAPNLMIESSEQDVVDLVTALTFHVGEVQRNPYHLRMPPWLLDNVRRGGEIVGGQGGAAPDFVYATLYRLRAWRQGGFVEILDGGRFIGQSESLAELFA